MMVKHRLCRRQRGSSSDSWRVAVIMRGKLGLSVCPLASAASSWLLVAAAQPQGSVTVN